MFKKIKSVFLEEGIINNLKRKNYLRNLRGKSVVNLKINRKSFKIQLDESNGFVDKYIYKWGIYEEKILKKVISYLNDNSIVIDIGANIGQHSLIFSLYAKHVHSFEPNKKVYTQFCESIALNSFKNISTYNYGVSDKDEVKTLYINPDNFGHSSVLEKYKSNTSVEIQLCKLDKFLGDLEYVDFIKIDVEGYELEVVLGNLDFFSKHRPIIFLELNLKDYDETNLIDFIQFIKQNNYTIYSFNQDKILSDMMYCDVKQDNILLY